jgi:sugar lactone lactonase YvrE
MGAVADVACVVSARALLGEGPVWDAAAQALWWVDIRGPAVHRYEPRTGAARQWPMPEEVGSLALRRDGTLLLALRSGFAFFDPATGAIERVGNPEPDQPDNRLNDGKCDRRGRFWVGSMHVSGRQPTGALYRLDPDRAWHRMATGITVPNSLAFAPDDRTLYFADTPSREIAAYAFDAARGTLGARRVFATVPEGAGYPDGSTVDAEGYLWSAHWDGGRLTRYAPDGRVDRVIELPVSRPTCPAFGGERLDVLYVTTASIRLDPAERARQPWAGGLLALDVGVRGLPEPRFGG